MERKQSRQPVNKEQAEEYGLGFFQPGSLIPVFTVGGFKQGFQFHTYILMDKKDFFNGGRN